jgi:hypothetical protein
MDGGTPLSSLESGSVPNKADDALMKQILAEMNQAGASVPDDQSSEPPPRYEMPPPRLQYAPRPMAAEESPQELPTKRYVAPRKNFASVLMDWLRDPIFLLVTVFVISLPAVHTYTSTVFPIFYSVGGALSWLGLFAKSLFVAVAFILFRSVSYMIGF